MSERSQRLTIGEVARRSGVKASTLRYYESLGVLPEPERVAGQRRYTADVLGRLAVVGDLLSAADEPAAPRMRALAASKLPEIEALIERAHAVHRWLQAASACECVTFEACSLFGEQALRG